MKTHICITEIPQRNDIGEHFIPGVNKEELVTVLYTWSGRGIVGGDGYILDEKGKDYAYCSKCFIEIPPELRQTRTVYVEVEKEVKESLPQPVLS